MKEATIARPAPVFLDRPLRLELSRRTRTPYSQEEFGKLLGIAKRTVHNYENGHTEPKLDVLEKWAELCGVPLEWLAFGVDRDPETGEVRSRCFLVNEQVTEPTVALDVDGVTVFPEIPSGLAADRENIYTQHALGA